MAMKTGARILRNIWTSSKDSSVRDEKVSFLRFGSADHSLLFLAFALTSFGLVMVYSASYIFAQERYGDGLYYFRRQLMYIGVGVIALGLTRMIDYRNWRTLALPLFLFSCASIVAVHIPRLGHNAGGATRWLNLGFTTVQPAEFAKIGLLVYMAEKLSRPNLKFDNFSSGFI